jgi:hypothetical protein
MAKEEVKASPKAMSDEDKDLLAQAKKFFERAETAESEQRDEELEDLKFVGLLDQWPDVIRKAREQDVTGSRPCLTVDKVNQYKNQIVNNMRMNTPSIKVRPVDDNGDEKVAEIYDGLLRHIQNKSHADDAYDWASEGAVDTGIGYFRVVTDYVGDSFEQEIGVAKIPNRFSVYKDPDSTQADGSDQMECIVTEFMRRDAFKKAHPNVVMGDWQATTGDSDRWDTEHEVRIAEYFYIEEKEETLFLLADGNAVFESEYKEEYGQPIKSRPAKKRIVNWCKLCSGAVLSKGTFAGDYIPIIPVMGIITVVDGKTYWRGIVRGAKDPQRMYNYNRSTIAESLSLTIKAPYVGAVGQFDTMGDRWATANNQNHAFLEYDPITTDEGVIVPAPQRQGFAGVPQGLMQDIQTSEHDIQSGMGMYQASIGQDSNAKSGKALNAQRQQGDMATFHFPDNLAKSIRHAGRIIVKIIPKYYDTQRVIRILGEDGQHDFVRIDPMQEEAFKQAPQEDGTKVSIYNLGVGTYDVTVTTGASFASKREEGAEFITQLVQSSPDLMPIVGDLLFKVMDMPYADEISERMKKMLPPQLQEQPEGGDNPEVQQVKAQASQIIQELQGQIEAANQAMAEAEQEAQQLLVKAEAAETKAEADILKAANEKKKLEIEEFKARTDRLGLQKDAVELMENNPMMPEFMQENMQMMQNLMQNVAAAIEQNQQLLEQLAASKSKSIEMQSPDGKVYRGVVVDGQMQVETPSGEVYTGMVN